MEDVVEAGKLNGWFDEKDLESEGGKFPVTPKQAKAEVAVQTATVIQWRCWWRRSIRRKTVVRAGIIGVQRDSGAGKRCW